MPSPEKTIEAPKTLRGILTNIGPGMIQQTMSACEKCRGKVKVLENYVKNVKEIV